MHPFENPISDISSLVTRKKEFEIFSRFLQLDANQAKISIYRCLLSLFV